MVRLCHGPMNGPTDDGLQFQYYVTDGTTIIGLLEKSLTSGSGKSHTMLLFVFLKFGTLYLPLMPDV